MLNTPEGTHSPPQKHFVSGYLVPTKIFENFENIYEIGYNYHYPM